MVVMNAVILRVNPNSLLVRNEANGEEVLVITSNASTFSVGDRIAITFNGQMTFSIPPQISAISINRLTPAPGPTPSEMIAVVLQRGNNFLVVRNTRGQQMRVDYDFARHFCVRQRVLVRYSSITLTNPPRVTATDVLPIC